jgi:hypothetical protein
VALEKERPLYEQLFLQDLDVSEDYLKKYADKIRARLRHAAEEFKSDHANMFAINMCLHAASSIILSHPKTSEQCAGQAQEHRGAEGQGCDFSPHCQLAVLLG